MNVLKRSLIVAMALGDGNLRHRTGVAHTNGYRYERNEYVLQIAHGPKQKAYCQWKADKICNALGGRKIKVRKYKTGPNGNYWSWRFSKSSNYFKQVRKLLYPNGKKRFTVKMLDMLTVEGLAIWYMDDGHARRNYNKNGWVTSVCTNIATSCTESEDQLIVDWFKDRHDIEWKKRFDKKRNQYSIECNTKSSRKFIALISDHVPECMKYKLSHVADLQSHER